MVHIDDIKAQLKSIGVNVKSWGASEIHELPRVLMPNEQITNLIHGWYENGFATLISTDLRLLLIDKKMFNLTLEDIRYDMISEVDYKAALVDATICINTVNKNLKFTSFKQRRLRDLTTYVQHRVMELRQHYAWSQFEETPITDTIQPLFIPAASPQNSHLQIPNFLQRPRPNPYLKGSLTTKHNGFLPKIPRRWRPSVTPEI